MYVVEENELPTNNIYTKEQIDQTRTQTSRVKHGRETANPNATTRVIADTAAPANGGYIIRLATTPHPSVAKAIP